MKNLRLKVAVWSLAIYYKLRRGGDRSLELEILGGSARKYVLLEFIAAPSSRQKGIVVPWIVVGTHTEPSPGHKGLSPKSGP